MQYRNENRDADADYASSDFDEVSRATRIFERGRIATPSGVELVSIQYGLHSIPVLTHSLNTPSSKTCEAAFAKLKEFGEPAFKHLNEKALEERGQLQIAIVKYLGRWGDSRAVDTIVRAANIDRGVQLRKKAGKITLYTLLGAALIAVVVLLLSMCGAGEACIDCGSLCGGCGGGGNAESSGSCFACEEAESDELRRTAIVALAGIDSLRSVSVLAQLVRDRNKAVSLTARQVLLEILVDHEPSSYSQPCDLGKDGSLRLAEIMPNQSYALAEAGLKTLGTSADCRVIPLMQSYASESKHPAQLRELALDTAKRIKQNVADLELQSTLLRGSELTGSVASGVLLRAAGAPHDEPKDQLLRPGDASKS